MKEERETTKSGFNFTVQKIGKISHLIISDSNIYQDEDSRSQDRWRKDGLLIPINNKEDLKRLSKIFNL